MISYQARACAISVDDLSRGGLVMPAGVVSTPRWPLIVNVDALAVTSAGDLAAALARQTTRTVRWSECLDRAAAFSGGSEAPTRYTQDATEWVSWGAGSALQAFARSRGLAVVCVADAAAVAGVAEH